MFRQNFLLLCSNNNKNASTSSETSKETKSTKTPHQQQQKLVKPKVDLLHSEEDGNGSGVAHKLKKYMSYRDPNQRYLRISSLVVEKHKGLIGMWLGAGVVVGSIALEQWEHIDEMEPMKLDGRSLVI